MAYADGGVVQASDIVGGYRVTVFTSPSPARVGPMDISVWVQDAASGATAADVQVELQLSPGEPGGSTWHLAATREAATNKLFRAATFDAPAAGRYRLEVNVSGPAGSAQLNCRFAVAEPLPQWQALWPWYSWPLAVMALMVWRELSREHRAAQVPRRD